jgi:hypothetical protein
MQPCAAAIVLRCWGTGEHLLNGMLPIWPGTPKWMLRDDSIRRRPYRAECTGSLLTSEVKRRRARLVLGWGTAREDPRVLPAIYILCAQKKFVLEVGALHTGRSRISEWYFITTY